MAFRTSAFFSLVAAIALMIPQFAGAQAAAGKVEGKFIVGGVDAQLKHARGARVNLDAKTKGYAVLLSARPATGDIHPWRSGDPKKLGSFIYVIFESNGAIYIAELGHDKAKTSRFGVVTEVQKVSFEVKGERLVAHISTKGEQVFTEDKYSVDLRMDVPLQ